MAGIPSSRATTAECERDEPLSTSIPLADGKSVAHPGSVQAVHSI